MDSRYVFDIRMLVAVTALDSDDAADKIADILGPGELGYDVECLSVKVNEKTA